MASCRAYPVWVHKPSVPDNTFVVKPRRVVMQYLRGSRALLYFHSVSERRYKKPDTLMTNLYKLGLASRIPGDGTTFMWLTTKEDIDKYVAQTEKAEADEQARSVHASMTSATASSVFNSPIGRGVHTAHKREPAEVKQPVADSVISEDAKRPWSWRAWIRYGNTLSNDAGYNYETEPYHYALPDGYWQAKE